MRIFTPPEWHKQAACKDMDTTIFFPEQAGIPSSQAKAVCHECSVSDECLDEAMSWGPTMNEHGVFGGLTARERTNLRKRRQKIARETA